MIHGTLEMRRSHAKDFQSADSPECTAAVNQEQILFPYLSEALSLDRNGPPGRKYRTEEVI